MTASDSDNKRIPVMELFGPVLQGEGEMIGVQTFFVRTGGCDYLCTKCDSLHAVLPQEIKLGKKMYTQSELAAELMASLGTCQWVTFSGGNPAMWDMKEVVKRLHAYHIRSAIETQGSVWRPWIADCDKITISPKGPGMVGDAWQKSIDDLIKFVNELDMHGFATYNACIKIPVFSGDDLDFCEKVSTLLLTKDGYWRDHMYMTVGNNTPDVPTTSEWQPVKPLNLQRDLLKDLNAISTRVMQTRPSLSHFKILPQLHVLQYGNERAR